MQDLLYAVVFMGVVFGCAALILALRDKLALRPDRSAEERETVSSALDPILDFVRGLLPSVDVEADERLADERQEPGVPKTLITSNCPFPLAQTTSSSCGLAVAKSKSAQLLADTEPAYFWYMPFEEVTFRSAEELNKALIEVVDQIMRITHASNRAGDSSPITSNANSNTQTAGRQSIDIQACGGLERPKFQAGHGYISRLL